jgi:ribonuclease J
VGQKDEMKLIIHRGAHEIGGSCVELRTQKSRILIDFGLPLVNQENVSKSLPNIEGLYRNQPRKIDAIFISHSHPDHYGLLKYVNLDIPIYMSQGAKELIGISDAFTPIKSGKLNAEIMENRKAVFINDIKVTPYLMDHSAFEAFAFLIEGEGKRVFYSGDFRGHGRKSSLFKQILMDPPTNIDCLLMEGTALGRQDKIYKNETSVQKRIEEVLREAGNITLLFASSQNIDRIVSAYKACRSAGAVFVIDAYTAYILEKLKPLSKGIPQFNWKDMRVKFYWQQNKSLIAKESVKTLYRYKTRKIDFKEINGGGRKFLILARANPIFPHLLNKLNYAKGTKLIYSLWEGYLTDIFRGFCADKGLIIENIHSSGHATLVDLKAFAKAIGPRVLIPFHTFCPQEYKKLFSNVHFLGDGEVFELP